MLKIRRNPMPPGGALLISNPRREKVTLPEGAIIRLNNPLAVRTNPLAVRTNPLAVRTNPLEIRSNPLAVRANPSSGGVAVIPGQVIEKGRSLMAKFYGWLGALPIVGKPLAMLSPAAYGALAVVPHRVVLSYAGRYIPSWLAPFAYSITGLVAAGLLEVLPAFTSKAKIQEMLVFAGGSVDGYRGMSGKSRDLGEGDLGEGNYSIVSYNDGDMGDGEMGADEMGALQEIEMGAHEISDAEIGNFADTCGLYDFSDAEILALGSAKSYHKMLKKKKKHHQSEGHRIQWLVKLIGHEQVKRLSRERPEVRQKVIAELKANANHIMHVHFQKGGGGGDDDRPRPQMTEMPGVSVERDTSGDDSFSGDEGGGFAGNDYGSTLHGGGAAF